MTLTLAYTHPKISREAFLAELKWHQDQDRIISGTYEQGNEKTFKGCAVGCSLHSVKRVSGIKDISYGDHAQYPVYLGIPQVLARLQDRIFEGLSGDAQKAFPLRFSESIAQNADLSGVFDRFIVRMLRDIALPAVSEKHSLTRTAIARVIAGFETQWANDTPQAAREETLNARRAAAYAPATAAAYAAAYAADAADADARSNAYIKMADILCEELVAAPVVIARLEEREGVYSEATPL